MGNGPIIIVGLGNPGRKYENTRHNLGFITVDQLAERHDIKVKKLKFKALLGEGNISGHKVILVKPQTFMNLSGQSVRDVVAFYKVDIEDVIIIYDDFDLPLGALRLRKFGSAGTHNGMRNIVYLLGRDDFPRIRIGTGRGDGDDLIDFVTGGFTKEEVPILEETVTLAADAAESFVKDGIDMAMNRFNRRGRDEPEQGEE